MNFYRMHFIIGKLTDEELLALKRGESIISKMLLIPDDYSLFHYQQGDEIQVETHDGNRIWTIIQDLEVIQDDERVILIFTLAQRPPQKNDEVPVASP